MRPGARIAAAIEILDDIADGTAAEAALTRWARRSRFAGSKDRAAVRDHVFDVLRCWRSAAVRGGGTTGRARMIGQLRATGADLDTLFDGAGHAPAPLSDAEQATGVAPTVDGDVWNLPDWVLPEWTRSLGDAAATTALALQSRAPIGLRVNAAHADRDSVIAELAADGITARVCGLAPDALIVTGGARALRRSTAYAEGRIELQDASSQAVVAAMPPGERVLDFCAGGGGKALALAAQHRQVTAHDIAPDRMGDIPARAARAGAVIDIATPQDLPDTARFDVVLCDMPCSGSGAWRRSPDGKWTLTPERLADLTEIQDAILDQAARHVADDGTLVAATCSVLRIENEDRVAAFVARNPGWQVTFQRSFAVTEDGDGFFTAHLTRA